MAKRVLFVMQVSAVVREPLHAITMVRVFQQVGEVLLASRFVRQRVEVCITLPLRFSKRAREDTLPVRPEIFVFVRRLIPFGYLPGFFLREASGLTRKVVGQVIVDIYFV